MAKQLNINLAFTADTAAAKQQLQQLQQQLNNLTMNSAKQVDLPLTKKLHEAQTAAASLQVALNSAINANTGKLDLSKFNQSLKTSGLTVEQLRLQLQRFGPEGNQAFMSLAQSIMTAEIPMRRTNALLLQLGTTLKNTAKWQISSSILHGFMSSIQTAYRYSQDLNKSLNNIRIVTGHNIEYMEKFAASANKAAKALSASTLDYTNASLIYYQQGLNDEEVKQRTEATVKMANVLGESAKDVSSYMTAIWNNFDDGTKSLEYYGDAMAALGAATASSSAEIAQGLEKFVSIGKTVGLTYEYATAALATVVAKTRQSADTVGTAFKTIFSRLQGLQLGETLDDGTTLNKYSEALKVVGVNIKTSTGELKQMDTILDELGGKWKSLAQDEKMALAQTVAGVRQYAQLISLMDNYEDFKSNVSTALNSSGTLDKQNEIYAEGWEAASKRVKAAMESIYSSILDDKFFIGILNGIEDFITLLDKAVKSMGGLHGVLAGLSTLLLKTFSVQAVKGLENMAYNMKMMTAYGRQQVKDQKNAFYNQAMKVSSGGYVSESQEATTQVFKDQLTLQHKLEQNAEKLSEEELKKYQNILDQNKAYGDQYIALTKNKEALQDQSNALNRQAYSERKDGKSVADVRNAIGNANQNIKGSVAIQQIVSAEDIEKVKQLGQSLQGIKFNSKTSQEVQKLCQELNDGTIDATVFNEKIKALKISEDTLNEELAETQRVLASEAGISEKTASKIVSARYQVEKATVQAQQAEENYKRKVEETSKSMEQLRAAAKNWAQQMVSIAQGLSSVAFGLSAISGIVNTLKDPDTSGWEKFLSIAMSLSMVLPALTTVVKLFNAEAWKSVAATTAEIGQKAIDTIVLWANTKATEKNTRAKTLNSAAKDESTKDSMEEAAADIVEKEATEASTKAELIDQAVRGGKPTADQMKKAGYTRYNGHYFRTDSAGNRTGNAVKRSTALKEIGASNQGAAITGGEAGGQSVVNGGSQGAASGGTFLKNLGTIAKTFLPIVIAIAAIAATTVIIYENYNKIAKEAEEAHKVAEAAKKTYQDTKAEHDDFINNISNYKTAKEGLAGLTKGTVEYSEALYKANEEAQKLIEQYEDLDYSIVNGQIVIDNKSLEKAQRESLNQLSLTQMSQNRLIQEAERKQLAADRQKFNRDSVKNSGDVDESFWKNVGTGAGGGAIAGGAIGTYFGPWGTLIGAAAGGIIGAVAGGLSTEIAGDSTVNEERALDLLAIEYQKNGNAIFASNDELRRTLEKVGVTDEKLIDSLVENSEETKKLTKRIAEQNEEDKANVAAIASTLFSDDERLNDNPYGDLIRYKEAEKVNKAEKSSYDWYLNRAEERKFNWFQAGGTDDAKSVVEEYFSIMGIDKNNSFKITDYKADGSVKYKYLEDGEWQKKTVSAEEIASIVSAEKAKEGVSDLTDEEIANYQKKFELIEKDLEKLGFSDTSSISLNKLVQQWFTDESFDLSDLTEAEIEALESGIKEADIDSSMKTALDVAIKNWEPPSVEDIATKITTNNEIIKSLKTGDTIEASKYENLSNDLKSYFVKQIDGTYKLIGSVDDLKKTVSENNKKAVRDNYISAKDKASDYLFNKNRLNQIDIEIKEKEQSINEKEILLGKEQKKLNYDWEELYNVASSTDKKNLDRITQNDASAYFANLPQGDAGYATTYIDTVGRVVDVGKTRDIQGNYLGNIVDALSGYKNTYSYVQDAGYSGVENYLEREFVAGGQKISYDDILQGMSQFTYGTGGGAGTETAVDTDKFIEYLNSKYGASGAKIYDALLDDGTWDQLHRIGTEAVNEGSSYAGAFEDIEAQYGGDTGVVDRLQGDIDQLNSEIDILEKEKQAIEELEDLTEQYAQVSTSRNELLLLYEDAQEIYNEYLGNAQQAEMESLNLDVEDVEDYALWIRQTNEEMADNVELSKEIAISQMNMEQGAESLSENWSEWDEVLRWSSQSSQEYQEVIEDLRKSVSNLFDIDESTLGADFFTSDVQALIDRIMSSGGDDLEAIYSVKTLLFQYLAKNSDIDSSIVDSVVLTMQNYKNASAGDIINLGGELIASINQMNEETQLAMLNMLSAYGLTAVQGEEGISHFIYNGLDSFRSALRDYEDSKETKDFKYLEDELERYYRITKQLERLSQVQERLSILKDNAYGSKKVKLIEEESKALEHQIKLQDQYIKELEDQAKLDKGSIAYFGAQFDDQGVITNYQDIMQQQIDEYNKAVSAYNNSSQGDYDQAVFEAAEERYEAFVDALSQYDTTMQSLDEATTERLQLENDLLDKALEKLQTEIEIKVELNDLALERFQYMLEKLDDPIEDAVAAIQNLGNQVTETLEKNYELQTGINYLLEQSKTRDLTADEIDQLKDWRSQLYENNEALREYQENVEQYLIGIFEAWNEELEESAKNLEKINSLLDTYTNIIDVVGEMTLGLNSKLIIDLAKSKVENSKANLEAAQISLEANRTALKDAYSRLNAATTEDEREVAQELIDSIQDQIDTLEDEVNSSWTSALEAAADAFQAQVERITKDLGDKLAGTFGSLENLSKYYERQSKTNDLYLADYEKIYELNKLNRNIMKEIDKADNVKAKSKLAKLQSEINEMLADNEKVSKRDVEYAQKKYDLKLAEIALEEAQEIKSQVRMTRDNEGNWSYTYVADENKISDAEQNYEDKLFNFQDYATESLSELESSYIDLQKSMVDELSGIDQTTEEGMKKAEEIRSYYMDLINANVEEQRKLLDSNALANQEYNTNLASNFHDTLFNRLYPDYVSFEQVKTEVDSMIVDSLSSLTEAYSIWNSDVSDIFELMGTTVDEFGKVTMPTLYDDISDQTENIVGNVESMKNNMIRDFKKVVDYTGEWYIKYKENIDKSTKENEELAKSVEDLITDYATLDLQEDIDIGVTSSNLGTLQANLNNIEQTIARINNLEVNPGSGNGYYSDFNFNSGVSTEVQTNINKYRGLMKINDSTSDYYNQIERTNSDGTKNYFKDLFTESTGRSASGSDDEKITNNKFIFTKNGENVPTMYQYKGGDVLMYKSGDPTFGGREYIVDPLTSSTYVRSKSSSEGGYNVWYRVSDLYEVRGKDLKGLFDNSYFNSHYKDDETVYKILLPNTPRYKMNTEVFDTGGYTGEWGNEGRMAMLHQKEIVLNATDTENFLQAINIVREISKSIDLNAQSASGGLQGIYAAHIPNNNQQIEQNVTIQAEFPNVNNHYEIEEAFNNLVNSATQYVMRK